MQTHTIHLFGHAYELDLDNDVHMELYSTVGEYESASKRLRSELEKLAGDANRALRDLDRDLRVNELGPVQSERSVTAAAAEREAHARHVRRLLALGGFESQF